MTEPSGRPDPCRHGRECDPELSELRAVAGGVRVGWKSAARQGAPPVHGADGQEAEEVADNVGEPVVPGGARIGISEASARLALGLLVAGSQPTQC